MSARTTPPFRAEHVGSLVRPPQIKAARDLAGNDKISYGQLREIEDDAIRDAVQLQQASGMQTITDGEFRRATWHMDFVYRIGGVVVESAKRVRSVFHDKDGGSEELTVNAARVAAKLRLDETIFGEDFEFLQSLVTGGVPKLSIPSPSMVHYRGGRAMVDSRVYPEMEAFWSDLAGVYQEQIRRLAEQGCTYLQFDDVSFACLNDPLQRAAIASRGEDGEHQHLTYIHTLNSALRNRPVGMTVATHMCRGNFRACWLAQGGYDFVAEPLFSELDVDAFFVEYDDERSGTFEPLRFVPKDKMVVLGLVTTKRPELESKDMLKRRIEEASRYVDIDRLCLSPQCGFSSMVDGAALTREQQASKLRLVAETAEEVWGGA